MTVYTVKVCDHGCIRAVRVVSRKPTLKDAIYRSGVAIRGAVRSDITRTVLIVDDHDRCLLVTHITMGMISEVIKPSDAFILFSETKDGPSE